MTTKSKTASKPATARRPRAEPARKKPYPTFQSGDEEQAFLDKADLTEYDLEIGFAPFEQWLAAPEAMHKDARVNLLLPRAMVEAYKQKGKARRMPYQRLMRMALQEVLKRAG
jgi:predicted DNA binding CopG/RHH family protein